MTAPSTRLDHAAAAAGEDPAALPAFLEALAAARLILPLADGAEPEEGLAALMTLPLEIGATALAFDTPERFQAFIDRPTAHVIVPGIDAAAHLAGQGWNLALNPGVAPSETVVAAAQLAWLAATLGAEVAESAPVAGRLEALADPEPALLAALGERLSLLGPELSEAWLAGLEGGETLLVLALSDRAGPVAGELVAELTRIGQLRSRRPFAVAPATPALLAAARRLGVGLAAG